jgi:molybdopterin-biosynthesis enzyme MoeA-like protein
MKAIFQAQVRLMLNQRFSLQPGTLVCIKTFGLGESEIQLRMHNIEIPESVQLGFRASMSEVQTKLWFPPNYPNASMTTLVDTVSALLGDNVFAIDGLGEATGDLVFVVDQLMQSQGQTLALVETASQGLIDSLCTGSAWLLESRYEISLARLAQKLSLTVQGDVVTTATAIAEQTRQTSGASLVLVQLYEGDFAALNNKDELVTLHTVLLAGNAKYHSQNSVAGLGKRKQNQAAQLALDLLRRYLQFGRI